MGPGGAFARSPRTISSVFRPAATSAWSGEHLPARGHGAGMAKIRSVCRGSAGPARAHWTAGSLSRRGLVPASALVGRLRPADNQPNRVRAKGGPATVLTGQANRLILEDGLNRSGPGKGLDAGSGGFDRHGPQRVGTSCQSPSVVPLEDFVDVG